MRRNKTETAESRRQILAQASHLFRERGPERGSVADLMEAAGMTHGGFYKHFASKDALFAATLEPAFAEKLGYLADLSSRAVSPSLGDCLLRNGLFLFGKFFQRSSVCRQPNRQKYRLLISFRNSDLP
jgi:AcrR family transcriptional regulator